MSILVHQISSLASQTLKVNVVIEVTGKQLADPPLKEVSFERPVIVVNKVFNCDSSIFVETDIAKVVDKNEIKLTNICIEHIHSRKSWHNLSSRRCMGNSSNF